MMTNTHTISLRPGLRVRKLPLAAPLLLAAFALGACGGGAETESNPPPPGTSPTVTYNGPAPAFPDVQAFRVSLWENIRGSNRCGACHTAGGQAPVFARSDDVNLAYQAAVALVELDNPGNSRLVTKVTEGHNCWLGNDGASLQACGDIMTTWIDNWAGSSGNGDGRQILLVAPQLVDPGESKAFPSNSASFDPIHQILRANCAGCHSSESPNPQSPYFAAEDRDFAYEAAKARINLDSPANSRFVVRLRDEFHNCWSNCSDDAAIMLAAIESFAGQISPDSIDGDLVTSKAMRLPDGIVASGGNRYEGSQVALWEFKSSFGATAFDTSGVDPAIDLTLSGDIEWVGGYGINIRTGKAQGSTTASSKLYNAISATGEYAIESWVAPANVTQEDAYILSYSGSDSVRNFTVGQTMYSYDAYNRSSSTDENGMPALTTADADQDLQATLQHVVVNFDPVNGRRIYVNGVFTDDLDPAAGGNISSWRNNFALVLGNETSGNRQWQGIIRLAAVHNRTLTEEQIQQNYEAGVGQKFFLLFYLGEHLTTVPEPYLLFEVSQFDSYSYLFNQPRFISLDSNVTNPGNPVIAGIRIGVNGSLVDVGQAFQFIDTRLPAYNAPYTADGQMLSPQGTIIPVLKGAEQDEFFLIFDMLGNSSNAYVEAAPLQPSEPPDGQAAPDIGLRTFDEINATLAAITTVSPQEPLVLDTYFRVKQQLPAVENFGGFLAAHQMAIAQLAVEYCNALVNDVPKRTAFWLGFGFPANVNTAFGAGANRDLVFDPLVNPLVLPDGLNNGLASQPDAALIKSELNALTDRLTACYDTVTDIDNCESGRTNTVVKAVCAAALGNAAMLVQ